MATPMLEVICEFNGANLKLADVNDALVKSGGIFKDAAGHIDEHGVAIFVPGADISQAVDISRVVDAIFSEFWFDEERIYSITSKDANLQKNVDEYIKTQISAAQKSVDSLREAYDVRRSLLKQYAQIADVIIKECAQDKRTVFIPDLMCEAKTLENKIRRTKVQEQRYANITSVPEIQGAINREKMYGIRNRGIGRRLLKQSCKLDNVNDVLIESALTEGIYDNFNMEEYKTPDWLLAATAREIYSSGGLDSSGKMTKLTTDVNEQFEEFSKSIFEIIQKCAEFASYEPHREPKSRENYYYGITALMKAYDGMTNNFTEYPAVKKANKLIIAISNIFDKYKRPNAQMKHIRYRINKALEGL